VFHLNLKKFVKNKTQTHLDAFDLNLKNGCKKQKNSNPPGCMAMTKIPESFKSTDILRIAMFRAT
jgi:hypothetical protein